MIDCPRIFISRILIALLFALAVFLFYPKTVFAQVVINEIMYDFEGSDDNHEWIEVKNVGNQSIDVTNWRFEEGGTKHTLTLKQGDINIAGGTYAVIADNTDQFLADYSGFSGTLIDSSFALSNTGEKLTLLETKDGSIVNEVTYSSGWGAAGNGRTLQKKNGEFAEGPIGGTPGGENEFPFIPTPTSAPTPTPTPTPTPKPTPTTASTPTPKPTATPKPTTTPKPAPTSTSIPVKSPTKSEVVSAGQSASPKKVETGEVLSDEKVATSDAEAGNSSNSSELSVITSASPTAIIAATVGEQNNFPQIFLIAGGLSFLSGGIIIWWRKKQFVSSIFGSR